MHIDVVAGENAPKDLLAVVVEVVVTVPRASDVSIRPISEQSWRGLMLSHTTRQEILIVIPNAFQILVENTHGRS